MDKDDLWKLVATTAITSAVSTIVASSIGYIAGAVDPSGIALCAVVGATSGYFGFRYGYSRGVSAGERRVHSGPSLSRLCAPLSERCRAMLLEAVENGEVRVFYPSDSDAAFLVEKGLLEAPSTVSPPLLTSLHVTPARFAALSRRKSELLGDIPAARRERLIDRR